MSFDKCKYLCNHHCIQDMGHLPPQRVPSFPFTVNSFIPHLRGSDFYHLILVFLVLWFKVNKSIQYIFFCDWYLSYNIMFFRFFHVICLGSFLFTPEQYSTVSILLLMELQIVWCLGLISHITTYAFLLHITTYAKSNPLTLKCSCILPVVLNLDFTFM